MPFKLEQHKAGACAQVASTMTSKLVWLHLIATLIRAAPVRRWQAGYRNTQVNMGPSGRHANQSGACAQVARQINAAAAGCHVYSTWRRARA
eukprot:1161466-Pelagomonas_calceolata.AAC.2